jgi:hypothetical protein
MSTSAVIVDSVVVHVIRSGDVDKAGEVTVGDATVVAGEVTVVDGTVVVVRNCDSDPNEYCPCSCHPTNMSIIMDTIAKLQEELKVHTETLSSTIRSKTCAEDPRPSAKNIGIMGVVVLSVIFSLVFLMDLISFRKTIS